MQPQQTMFKKYLIVHRRSLPLFAPFRTLFTDKTRTSRGPSMSAFSVCGYPVPASQNRQTQSGQTPWLKFASECAVM